MVLHELDVKWYSYMERDKRKNPTWEAGSDNLKHLKGEGKDP